MSRWLLEDFSEVGRLEHSDAGGSTTIQRASLCRCARAHTRHLVRTSTLLR
jgi:hypothetical protein